MVKSKSQDISPLVKTLSDLTIRIARRVLVADKGQVARLNSALILSNTALQLIDKSPKDARKMIDLMRRTANIKD